MSDNAWYCLKCHREVASAYANADESHVGCGGPVIKRRHSDYFSFTQVFCFVVTSTLIGYVMYLTWGCGG